MKKNQLFLFLLIALFSTQIQAQETKIEGTVLDKMSKEALVGASISIKDAFDGASTDANGHFQFFTEESGSQTLLIRYIGYQDVEIPLLIGEKLEPIRILLQENLTKIDEVVISAGSFEASDEKKGTVLQPLDIVTIPGANGDITGALNTLPGTTINGESGQLIVRGGSASETRIYIDGLATRNYYSSGLQDVPVRSRFSPFQFKGTTFASGGYSAEYGQALSSTLILNTADMPEQGGKFVGISCLGANLGITKLQEKSAWSAAAGYTNLGPYLSLVKKNLDFIKAPEAGFANLEGRIKTKNYGIVKMGVQGSLNRVTIGYPQLPFETEAFQTGIVNQNARAFAVWRQPKGEKWSLYSAVQAEVNQDALKLSNVPEFKLNNFALSGRFNANYAVNTRFRLKNGAEYNFYQFKNSFAPDALQHAQAAIFSEAESYIGQRFVLRTGLRAEYDHLIARTNLAPRLSAAYRTGKDAQISASWGLFYQSADDTLLYRYNDLNFERAQHFILNYQISRGGRIFRVETYYKQYSSLVRSIQGYDNGGKGYAQGLELFFRDRTSFKWGDYWISYSFLDTKRQFRDYPISVMPTFAARHNASFVYKYYFSKPQISTSLSYTYQTGRPYYNPNNPDFLSDRTPAYNNLSIQVSKLTSIHGNFTVLVLSVNNILGIQQVFNYRYTAIPNTAPQEYYRQEILPPMPQFFFIGCFINIGDKRTKVGKDEALE